MRSGLPSPLAESPSLLLVKDGTATIPPVAGVVLLLVLMALSVGVGGGANLHMGVLALADILLPDAVLPSEVVDAVVLSALGVFAV